jgi:hypothetical protein
VSPMRFGNFVHTRDVLASCWLVLLWAGGSIIQGAKAQPIDPEQPVLEVFVRDGCHIVRMPKNIFRRSQPSAPGLRIAYRSLDTDARAREDLVRHSQRAGIWPPGVPTLPGPLYSGLHGR